MSSRFKKQFYHLGITFGVLLLTGLFSLLSPLRNLELKVLDLQFRLRGPMVDRDTSLVVVNIDDQTFSSIPQKWPYPRSFYAKMIRNLNEAGARLIVFDLEFTDPDVNDISQDEALAQAAREAGNVIFAGKLVTEFGSSMTINRYVLPPIPEITRLDSSSTDLPWGLVNIIEDDDGFLRRYYLSKTLGEHQYFPIAILAAKTLLNVSDEECRDGDDVFHFGKIRIPKVTSETMLINYAGPANTFRTHSFVNVLDDFELDLGAEDTDIFELHKMWGTFKDKIVFVGSSAEELQDTKFAPFYQYGGVKRKIPGVEVHLNAVNTILTGKFLRYLPIWLRVIFLACFVVAVGWLVNWLKPLKAGVLAVILIALYSVVIYIGFVQFRLIFPLVTPLLAIGLSYFGNTAYLYATEQKEKVRYRKIFQQYVAKDVVEQMLDSGKFPSFGGERKELTVLFSDIRDFTKFSEHYGPDEVTNRLSEYLTAMVDVILQHNGTLDKFIGDAIMAIFGAPFYYPNHAEKACYAAFHMIQELKKIQQVYAMKNEKYFEIGIGINTGDMVVGNLGSQQLFDYTVIGDAVNQGSRLEGLNKYYGTRIIISESTLQAAGNHLIVRELDQVIVKGKELPIRIYELLGIDTVSPTKQRWLRNAYQRGLDYYAEKKWYNCLREMSQILRHFPDDGPAKLYIRRCLDLIENPPQEDWQPVVKYETK